MLLLYIKENIIKILQKLYRPTRNPTEGNKSHALYVKNLFARVIYCLHTKHSLKGLILQSMLRILLSILSVIRHLICGNNWNWLLNLNLIYKTLWTGAASGLLISVPGKLDWLLLTCLTTMVALMWKWVGLFLRKNHLSRGWGWSSLLKWIGALTLSLLLKLAPRKLEL